MKFKQEILRLRTEGKSHKKIAAILGCSKSTVGYHCGEGQVLNNRIRVKRGKGRELSQDDIEYLEKRESDKAIKLQEKKDKLLDMVERGLTQPEMASEMSVAVSTIKKWLRKSKISVPRQHRHRYDNSYDSVTHKFCPKCKLEKEVICFTRRKDGKYITYCKPCNSEVFKEWYRKHKTDDQIRNRFNDYGKKLSKKIKQEVNEIKARLGCVSCGEKEACCLDFHHLRDKIECVSILCHKKSRRKVLEEIEKCIVLCSNCHRKHHAGIISLPE